MVAPGHHSPGATDMLQFLLNINLKPHAKFHGNMIKTVQEQTVSIRKDDPILNFTLATSVLPPSCSHLRALIFISFQYSKCTLCKL